MADWKLLVLKNLLLFCLVSSEKQPDTLNVLSILLPYSTAGSANVNFTIWASDGCYKWLVYFALSCTCLFMHVYILGNSILIYCLDIWYRKLGNVSTFMPGCDSVCVGGGGGGLLTGKFVKC